MKNDYPMIQTKRLILRKWKSQDSKIHYNSNAIVRNRVIWGVTYLFHICPFVMILISVYHDLEISLLSMDNA